MKKIVDGTRISFNAGGADTNKLLMNGSISVVENVEL